MARAGKKSDDTYNARRRYARQAERYAKKAKQAHGATRSRFESMAQQAANKALSLYEKRGALFTRAKEKFTDLGISNFEVAKPENVNRESLEAGSTALIGGRATDEMRDAEAKNILTGNIGSRFYGGLISIWRDSDDINQAILDHFGAGSLMDVLERFEAEGIDIYAQKGEADENASGSDKLRQSIALAFAV